jgi:diacylglycerol kinase family enzyme
VACAAPARLEQSRVEPFLAVGGELWLETDRPARVEVDGELRGHTPLRISLDADALRVMAKSDSPDR